MGKGGKGHARGLRGGFGGTGLRRMGARRGPIGGPGHGFTPYRPVAMPVFLRPRFHHMQRDAFGPRDDEDDCDEDAAFDMVLWVQDIEPPHDDPYFLFCLARWRRTHPVPWRGREYDDDPFVAAYRRQLPGNGPNFVFLPDGMPTAELWPYVQAISRRVGTFDTAAWQLTLSAAATPCSSAEPIQVALADGAFRAELADVLQAVRAVGALIDARVDAACCCPRCKRRRAAHVLWSLAQPWFCCVPCVFDERVEQVHLDFQI